MRYAALFVCLALLFIPKISFCDTTEDNLKAITDTIPQNWWDGGWDKTAQLQDFINNNPTKPFLCAQAQYYIGCYYYSVADYDNAIRAYDTVVSAYSSAPSECARAEYEISQIYLNCKHDPRMAITEYSKAISYNDTLISPMSEVGIGKAYTDLKDYPQAEAAFKRVIDGYPDALRQKYDAYMGLGYLSMIQSNSSQDKAKVKEAISYYKKAYQACPVDNSSLLQYTIAKIHESLRLMDNSMGRANRFIKYQKYGPAGEDGVIGTADDLTDPLAEF